jgi:redox-sensitive bicupin YhaK (pirin superfamily)
MCVCPWQVLKTTKDREVLMDRRVKKVVRGFKAIDGAGVHLVRVLSNETVREFDPFLMLDSFDSTNPDDYTAGFPLHPHRGIETITYVRLGKMHHRDSLGFEDTVSDGELQWMCAGSGILHEETIPPAKRMLGVQLWLNLPHAQKMATPHYHAVGHDEIEDIPVEGGSVRLLAGTFEGHKGYQSSHLPLDYYDIGLEPGAALTIPVGKDRAVMVFTLLGDVTIGGTRLAEKSAAHLADGDSVTIKAEDKPVHVLFMSSKALNEPVAWGGPIVMNTEEELNTAFEELREGTFQKELTVDD